MRKQLLILLFIFFGVIGFAQNNIDVLHYNYFIYLDDKDDTLKGGAIITCLAKEDNPVLQFDLYGLDKNGKGMLVTLTSFNIEHQNPYPFKQQNNKVVVASSVKKGDTAFILINYKGIPDDGLIISKNKYGKRTFFADNWPNRAHHWIPCVDRPNDKASFEFNVFAPSHYSVISNGKRMEVKNVDEGKKLTHWKEDIPLPTKVMVIGIADFAVKTYEDSPAGIPVSAWVYKQDSIPGFRNYSVSPAILKFLIDYIGPYPYNKLANVQSKTIFGGMENASCIFYEELSASSDDNVESLIAHETAHQWFGDMASEKSFPHLWLSEGFATYLTHIYLESKYGPDSLNKRMQNDRREIIDFAKQSNKTVVDSVSSLMNLLNTNSYQKGGWILHMLRRQLGDSVFHRIIRKYYVAYAGGNAETRDFEKICEKESGKDLHVFFDQWLYSPGVPKLDVQWSYNEKNKTVAVTVKQLQKNLFQFPLNIKLQSASGSNKVQLINVTQQKQQFSIPVKEKIVQLILDPDTSLLFDGSVHTEK